MAENPSGTAAVILMGGIVAFLFLLAGIAVPLAGGTDFGGLPRVLGALVIVATWLLGVGSAAKHREWAWLVVLILFSPLALVVYGTNVSEDFTYPEAWSEFEEAPWYLIALMLTPVVLVMYGLYRARRGNV